MTARLTPAEQGAILGFARISERVTTIATGALVRLAGITVITCPCPLHYAFALQDVERVINDLVIIGATIEGTELEADLQRVGTWACEARAVLWIAAAAHVLGELFKPAPPQAPPSETN